MFTMLKSFYSLWVSTSEVCVCVLCVQAVAHVSTGYALTITFLHHRKLNIQEAKLARVNHNRDTRYLVRSFSLPRAQFWWILDECFHFGSTLGPPAHSAHRRQHCLLTFSGNCIFDKFKYSVSAWCMQPPSRDHNTFWVNFIAVCVCVVASFKRILWKRIEWTLSISVNFSAIRNAILPFIKISMQIVRHTAIDTFNWVDCWHKACSARVISVRSEWVNGP